MTFFRCTSLEEYISFLNRTRRFEQTFNGHQREKTKGCHRVTGQNDTGLRRYDYQRKLKQQYNRAA